MSTVEEADRLEQLQQQRWQWRLERIAWVAVALLLVAALLGYLGRGPLTWSETLSPQSDLLVRHYWLEHCQCPTELRLAVNEPELGDQPVEIAISRSFLDATTPLGIWPPPAGSRAQGDEMVFTFNIASGDQHEIVYRYEHEEFGPLRYDISLNGLPPVVVKQFVFP